MNIDVDSIASRWEEWARQATARASTLAHIGEIFDATLKVTRAQIRQQAANLLRTTADIADAARLMHRQAVEASVRTPPLIGYDDAAIRYTRARTWQACARELEPDLPEVQPRWT